MVRPNGLCARYFIGWACWLRKTRSCRGRYCWRPGARIREFCKLRRLARLIETHLCDLNSTTGYALYRSISTEIWLQQCIGEKVPAPGAASEAPRLKSTSGSPDAEVVLN